MRYIYSHNTKDIKLLQSILKLDDDTDQFILNWTIRHWYNYLEFWPELIISTEYLSMHVLVLENKLDL